MIFLFTDYGLQGSYIGQVKSELLRLAPHVRVINLLADAPRHKPKPAAYLLASLVAALPPDSILFCVVDPGVGADKDRPVLLNMDGRRFVGPDNGLFDIAAARAEKNRSLRNNLAAGQALQQLSWPRPLCAGLREAGKQPGHSDNAIQMASPT